MKISFSTLACPDWDFRTIVEKSKEYGYDGIEIRGILKEIDLAKVPELNEDFENTKKLLDKYNLEISVFLLLLLLQIQTLMREKKIFKWLFPILI